MTTAIDGFDVETLQLVRLHVVDGRVWYGHDVYLAEGSGWRVDEFLDRAGELGISLDSAETVRLLGVRENAQLVVKLHERRVACHLRQRIELGTPALLAGRDRRDPAKALQCLWQPEVSQLACGGWHNMTVWDFPSYAMVADLVASGPSVPEKAVKALAYHPAWPAISFLPRYRAASAVRLIATIVDPRWFRHPFRPHRISRLLQYLGVVPANMRAFFADGPPGRHYDRAATVIDVWFTRDLSNIRDDPGNFLWRTYLSSHNQAVGLLRACRRFVRFLYEVWLGEAVCRNVECGFLASNFFKDAGERDAYVAHRRGMS